MAQHATAMPKDLEVKTVPLVLKMGVTPNVAVPRPDLSGLRLKSPNNPAVYVVDPQGFVRWIPDPATYNNLFRDWNSIVTDVDLVNIAQGPALTSGAVLAQGSSEAAVYLVSGGTKQWITSPSAMDKYDLNWKTVVQVPNVLVDSIPTGPSWS
jgi:hypothetical protein